VRARAPPSLE
jgi:hypothetical protein